MTDSLVQKTSSSNGPSPSINASAGTSGFTKLSNGGSPSSGSNSSCPSPKSDNTSNDMVHAVEELRRENQRIYAELANTQEVLDLFEDYRTLIREQMSMCICSGRDYHLDRYRKMENEYRKSMPIRRIIDKNQLMKASGVEQYSDNVVSIIDGSAIEYQMVESRNGEMLRYKIGPGYDAGINGLKGRSSAPMNDVICSAISTNTAKSKVRSFLDQIEGIEGQDSNSLLQPLNNHLPQVQSIVASVPINSNHQPLHSTPNNSLVSTKGNQIIVRKRFVPPEMMTVDEESSSSVHAANQVAPGILVKKAKLGGNPLSSSLVPGQKYTILTTNNKFSITGAPKVLVSGNNLKTTEAQATQEVQRLDLLNNALDQLIMGRIDALNGLPQTNSRTILRGVAAQHLEENVKEEEGQADDDEDIIFLDEIKSDANKPNASMTTAIAVPLKPKIVIAGGQGAAKANAGSAPSILGAALESGFKPYPTYHQIGGKTNGSTGGNTQSIMNHATIKIFQPTTSQTAAGTTTSTPIAVAFQSGSSASNASTTTSNNITVINNKALFQKRPHLTNEERLDIINRLKKNESGARIARDYGITKQAVSAIKRRAQLMGDNFSNVNTYIQAFSAPSSANSHANNSTLSISKASPITINLSPTLSNSSSPQDNSLVSRQMKQQQKVNATVIRQSNILASMPRPTSSLCLPVNPVAILKSQMAKQGSVSSKSGSGSSTPTGHMVAANSPSAKLKIDSKRLLLPRLLQGTETYQTYASTSKDPVELNEVSQAVKEEYSEGEEEEGEEDEDEGEDGETFTPQPLPRSGKPFSFAMRQAMKNESQEESPEDSGEDETVYESELDQNALQQLHQNLMTIEDEVDEEEEVQYNDADNQFDPSELIDLGEFHDEDINNNPGIEMEGLFSRVDETMDPMMGGGEDQVEEDEDGHLNGEFDQFNESLLMSD